MRRRSPFEGGPISPGSAGGKASVTASISGIARATARVGDERTWSYETTPPGPNFDYAEYTGTIDGLSMTVSHGASSGGQQDFLTCSFGIWRSA